MTGRERLLSVAALAVAFVVLGYAVSRRSRAGKPAPSATPSTSSTVRLGELPAGVPLIVRADRSEPTGCHIEGANLEAWFDVTTDGARKRFVPKSLAHADKVDVVIHLHGGLAAAKLLAAEQVSAVVVSVDRGTGSRVYEDELSSPRALESLLGFALGDDPAARPAVNGFVVSAWSAGYAGVRTFLHVAREDDARFRGVVLLDALHASYEGPRRLPEATSMAPFVAFAERAASGRSGFFLSHTSIIPPDYASTTETADYLLRALHLPSEPIASGGLAGLTLTRVADRGGFHVRGFTGGDPDAHCNQLRLLPKFARAALRGAPIE